MKKVNMKVGNYYNIYNHDRGIKCTYLGQYAARFETKQGRTVSYMYQQVSCNVYTPKSMVSAKHTKLCVGDKVKVLDSICSGRVRLNPEMHKHIGKEFTIRSVSSRDVRLNESGVSHWSWDIKWLERVECTTPKPKAYGITKSQLRTGMTVKLKGFSTLVKVVIGALRDRPSTDICFISSGGSRLSNGNDYTEDLIMRRGWDKYIIEKIWDRPKELHTLMEVDTTTKVLYEPVKPVRMTVKEIECRLGITNLEIVKC